MATTAKVHLNRYRSGKSILVADLPYLFTVVPNLSPKKISFVPLWSIAILGNVIND